MDTFDENFNEFLSPDSVNKGTPHGPPSKKRNRTMPNDGEDRILCILEQNLEAINEKKLVMNFLENQ